MNYDVVNSLLNAADVVQALKEENEMLQKKLLAAQKREFIVYTPKGNLKVWAKNEIDCFNEYPGVYVDIIKPGGDDLLCCVEYDSLADGLYARVYADGDAPTESVRFENLDDDTGAQKGFSAVSSPADMERNEKAFERLSRWENCGLSIEEAIKLGKLNKENRLKFYPCVPGDTVYEIRTKHNGEFRKSSRQYDYSCTSHPNRLREYPESCYVAKKTCTKSDILHLGDTVFLTEEEAMKRLEEAKNAKADQKKYR